MGYGFGVRERYECGRNGRATLSIDALGVPRFTDAPRLSTFIVEAPDPHGPFGAKGIGEIPLNPAAPAIAAAIRDATGVYPASLPMAPRGTVTALGGVHTDS
jgi:CO/xanthine dehydrogenase Mo-binding subunit